MNTSRHSAPLDPPPPVPCASLPRCITTGHKESFSHESRCRVTLLFHFSRALARSLSIRLCVVGICRDPTMGVCRKVDECLRLESIHGLHANKWLNNDVIPLPPDRRTWNSLAFTSFWAINNLCPAAFMIGSSLVALGLSVWQALLSVVVS